MRTYDLEKIYNYCMECVEQGTDETGCLDMGITLMLADVKDGVIKTYFDYRGLYLWDFVHHAYDKGWFRDICFKSIQRDESSILTVAQVNELLESMKNALRDELKKRWTAPTNINADLDIDDDDFVLLELSYTDQSKRTTEIIIATDDWFDNISDFYDSWHDECLQDIPQ